MVVYSDNFNRADGAVQVGQPSWQQANSSSIAWVDVLSNQAVTANDAQFSACLWTPGTRNPDQFSMAISQTATDGDNGVIVRASGQDGTYKAYGFLVGAGLYRFAAFSNPSTFSNLASNIVGTVSQGSTLRMEVSGQGSAIVLKYYINGLCIQTITNPSVVINAGSPGIVIFNSSAPMDNWLGGDFISQDNYYGGVDGDQWLGGDWR